MYRYTFVALFLINVGLVASGCSCAPLSHTITPPDAGVLVDDDAGPLPLTDAAPLPPDAFVAPDVYVPTTDAGPPTPFSCTAEVVRLDHPTVLVDGNADVPCAVLATVECDAPSDEAILIRRVGSSLVHGEPSVYREANLMADGTVIATLDPESQRFDYRMTEPYRIPAGGHVTFEQCFRFNDLVSFAEDPTSLSLDVPRSGYLMSVAFTGGELEGWGADYVRRWNIEAYGETSGTQRFASSPDDFPYSGGLVHNLRHAYPRLTTVAVPGSELVLGTDTLLYHERIEAIGRRISIKKHAWRVECRESASCDLTGVRVEGVPPSYQVVIDASVPNSVIVSLIFNDELYVETDAPIEPRLYGTLNGPIESGTGVYVSIFEGGSYNEGILGTGRLVDMPSMRESDRGPLLPAPHIRNRDGREMASAFIWSDLLEGSAHSAGIGDAGSPDWINDQSELISYAFQPWEELIVP